MLESCRAFGGFHPVPMRLEMERLGLKQPVKLALIFGSSRQASSPMCRDQ